MSESATSPRCKTCKHWSLDTSSPIGFGECSRWNYGYYVSLDKIASHEVIVENDEGWGAMIGPNFGCVLHEAKADA